MRKRVSLAAATALLSTLAIAGAVSAGPPAAGCPSGSTWELFRPIHQPQAADHNGDGLICRRVLDNGSLVWFDNVVR